MAFQSIGDRLVQFNSSISCDLFDAYNSFIDQKIRAESDEPSSRTFAPSSMRCLRKSWFRLRGVEKESDDKPDHELDFSARLGECIHQMMQANLKEMFGQKWLSPSVYIADQVYEGNFPYSFTTSVDGYETRVKIEDPPIQFSVDGLLRLSPNNIYLVEIKTCEYSTLQSLTTAKAEHIDQVKAYCAILGLSHVLFIYQDRQYGNIKCFEVNVTDEDKSKVLKDMEIVMECVDYNLPPERLPRGDKWCTASMCPYYNKCKEWG